jgi:hypothetical protein
MKAMQGSDKRIHVAPQCGQHARFISQCNLKNGKIRRADSTNVPHRNNRRLAQYLECMFLLPPVSPFILQLLLTCLEPQCPYILVNHLGQLLLPRLVLFSPKRRIILLLSCPFHQSI